MGYATDYSMMPPEQLVHEIVSKSGLERSEAEQLVYAEGGKVQAIDLLATWAASDADIQESHRAIKRLRALA